MSSGAAREHVRVARALRDLPVIRAEFAAARLSYAKVRALTRIATPDTERGLAELAGPMTGNQLERFARAHRQVTSADDAGARVRRRLAWRFEEDGSLAGTFRLPPLAGAVLLKALRAAAGDLEHPHGNPGGNVSAETPAPGSPAPQVPGEPADPARCHVEDGPALSVSTAQMLSCTAALSWMRHDGGGAILDLGRRRRRPNAALRRAARERDHLPLPVPRLRIPPRRPAPHHVLEPRRPDQPGQPGQLVQSPPHAGARARLPDRRAAGRRLRLLPPRRHRAAGQPGPAPARRHHRRLPRRHHHA